MSERCAWVTQDADYIAYHDQQWGRPVNDSRELFESGVYFNVIIKGLGGSGPLGVTDMLNDGLFNYRKPLYLRN